MSSDGEFKKDRLWNGNISCDIYGLKENIKIKNKIGEGKIYNGDYFLVKIKIKKKMEKEKN